MSENNLVFFKKSNQKKLGKWKTGSSLVFGYSFLVFGSLKKNALLVWLKTNYQKPITKIMPFDYTRDYAHLDLRQHPELYRVGIGEQGVLLVQPYKAEILPHWRFKDAVAATASSTAIWSLFEAYFDNDRAKVWFGLVIATFAGAT